MDIYIPKYTNNRKNKYRKTEAGAEVGFVANHYLNINCSRKLYGISIPLQETGRGDTSAK